MSNSKPIPIFKLPVLVQEVVVELLRIDDTFILALCSKRCYRVLQYAMRKNKHLYQLKLCFGDYWDRKYKSCGLLRIEMPSIDATQTISVNLMKEKPRKISWPQNVPHTFLMRYREQEEEEEPFSAIMGKTPFEVLREGSLTRTYWNNANVGMKALIVYISELFDTPYSISINHTFLPSSLRINLLPLLDLLNERQRTIPSAIVNLSTRDDIFKPTLDRLNIVEDLVIPSDMTTCVKKYANRDWEHKSLKFRWAPWIQPTHLLRMNCNRIEIESCVMRYEKMNSFLKAWMVGAVPRLVHLTIGGLKSDNIYGIFDGIPHQVNPHRVLATLSNRQESVTINPVDVLRSDGAVGTVFYSKVYEETRGGWSSFQFDFVVSK